MITNRIAPAYIKSTCTMSYSSMNSEMYNVARGAPFKTGQLLQEIIVAIEKLNKSDNYWEDRLLDVYNWVLTIINDNEMESKIQKVANLAKERGYSYEYVIGVISKSYFSKD